MMQEGAFTVVFGIFSFFFLPRSPSTASFLSVRERAAAVALLKADWTGEEEHEPFTWAIVWRTFKAPQVLLMALAFFFNG